MTAVDVIVVGAGPTGLMTAEFLETRLVRRGVPVLRGYTVVDVACAADGVTVTAEGPDGEVRHHGRYLVAADGGRSTIRGLMGLDFPGRQGTSTSVTAEAVVTGTASTRQGLTRSPSGHWAIQFPLEGAVRRLVVGGPGRMAPRDAEVTMDELRTARTPSTARRSHWSEYAAPPGSTTAPGRSPPIARDECSSPGTPPTSICPWPDRA